MKKLILLIFLVIGTLTAIAQVVPYAKVSIDPKMALEGAHPSNDAYADHSLDYEIQYGVEFEVKNTLIRVSQSYQSHKEINYSKFTFLMVDYMLEDFPLKNINCYAGVEWGSITRKFPDAKPTDTNWRTSETSMWHWGLNAELQWMFLDNLGVTSHINFFRAEPALVRDGKKVRWEVMVGVVCKINYWKW